MSGAGIVFRKIRHFHLVITITAQQLPRQPEPGPPQPPPPVTSPFLLLPSPALPSREAHTHISGETSRRPRQPSNARGDTNVHTAHAETSHPTTKNGAPAGPTATPKEVALPAGSPVPHIFLLKSKSHGEGDKDNTLEFFNFQKSNLIEVMECVLFTVPISDTKNMIKTFHVIHQL